MDIVDLGRQLERYHRESYGWALRCCSGDPWEAEDVVQAVYLKVLEGKAQYDGRATFRTWLFSVIRNTAVSERRRKTFSRIWLIGYQESGGEAIQEDCVDETIYRSHLRSALRRFLAALPKRQQEVLHLVFYHDLSLQEAADVMRISIGSARAHYDRGKKRLRRWMEDAKIIDGSREGREGTHGAVPRPAAGG